MRLRREFAKAFHRVEQSPLRRPEDLTKIRVGEPTVPGHYCLRPVAWRKRPLPGYTPRASVREAFSEMTPRC